MCNFRINLREENDFKFINFKVFQNTFVCVELLFREKNEM